MIGDLLVGVVFLSLPLLLLELNRWPVADGCVGPYRATRNSWPH
jgi:hypothetical protein